MLSFSSNNSSLKRQGGRKGPRNELIYPPAPCFPVLAQQPEKAEKNVERGQAGEERKQEGAGRR